MVTERKVARIARNGFREIVASLQREIEDGIIDVGGYLPTERELQGRFGASRTTIRKALAALVDSGWAKSVPNRGVVAARGLRPQASNHIALIDGDSYVLRVVAVRLADMLQQRGYTLVHMGGSVDCPMEYALQRAIDGGFAGAIVWPYRGFPDAEIVQRAARQLPIIALDHGFVEAETDLVTFDHERAAYDATAQLIRQGCRRVGVTGMMDMLDITHQRFRGYMRALFDYGLQPLARDYVFTVTSGIDDPDVSMLEKVLRSGDRPDGFLVLQDIYMPATVECALRCGLSVPYDLKFSTLGDDLDLSVNGIGMTAVSFEWDVLIEEALTLMLDRIENLHRPPVVRHAPHRLLVRGLCGAPSSEWTSPSDAVSGFRGTIPLPKSQFRYTASWSVQSSGR